MDLNLVVLCGRLAAPAEHRHFESGASHLRLLLAVRSDQPHRRVDLIPVILWNPPGHLTDGSLETGARVWISGALHRRLWERKSGRRSGIEVVAMGVTLEEVAGERAEAQG